MVRRPPKLLPAGPQPGSEEGERAVAALQVSVGAALSRLGALAREVGREAPPELAPRLARLGEEAAAAQSALDEAMAHLARGGQAGGTARRRGPGTAGARSGPAVRVLVIDGHPVVHQGLAAAVASDGGMVLTEEAHSVEEALRLLRRARPQVILLDYHLPDMLAPEAVPVLRHAAPEARVVLFTAERGRAALEAVLQAGLDGCLLKDTPTAELVDTVRRVAAGEAVFDARLPGATRPGPQARAAPPLTRREYEVLRRVAMGETNVEIARAIGLSRNTIKTYLHGALVKLGARNRVEALARASEAGLL